jgi:hypothetical protein
VLVPRTSTPATQPQFLALTKHKCPHATPQIENQPVANDPDTCRGGVALGGWWSRDARSHAGRPVTAEDKEKWQQLQTKYEQIPHEDAAYDILKEKYPALALTIRKHRYTALLDENEKPITWEEKLVYYADKRVMHDKIVSLEERLTEGHKRNALFSESQAKRQAIIDEVDPLIFKMEKEIFDKIGLNPLDITDEFINSNSVIDKDNRLNIRPVE